MIRSRLYTCTSLVLFFSLLLAPVFSASARSASSPAQPESRRMEPPPPSDRLTGPQTGEPVAPADNTHLPPSPQVNPATEPKIRQVLGQTRRSLKPAQQNIPVDDPHLQSALPADANSMPAPLVNFDGVSNLDYVLPPDTDGQVGPNHYVQMINLSTAIFGKSGNLLYGPFHPNTLWPAGDPCNAQNDGDPVVLYDQLADRWLLSQFALPNYPNGPFYECIAVSKGPTPTNVPSDWYVYSFLVHNSKMNDYPKLGVWPDGYYMTANQFPSDGSWPSVGVWAFDRQKMLNGESAAFQYFDLGGAWNTWSLLPANLMGSNPPPAGAPNYMASVDQDWSGSNDVLHIFAFDVDWQNPANTSFSLVKDLVVDPFDGVFSGGRNNIPQPGTTAKLDAIGGSLMMHLWYRNFGTHDVLVANQTVDTGVNHAGVRWYEIRNPGPDAILHQQGTFAPDAHNRWMGSIAMDAVGNIALGYSISSSTVYPGIRIAGRLAGDPLNTLTQGETVIVNGGGSQTHPDGRWGDYSALSVDPVDDCTFWYTQEYLQSSGSAPWRTRIAAFRFPSCLASTGSLQGTIRDGGGTPLSGATVTAQKDAQSYIATSRTDGTYGFSALPAGNYMVTVEKYGYLPASVSNVSVSESASTTQNFNLATAPTSTIQGAVSDAATGWPLYARLDIDGYPNSPVWSNPLTGAYSVELVDGAAYTFTVSAWSPGYQTLARSVGPVGGNANEDFALQADLGVCRAPGYQPVSVVYEQDFESDNGAFTHSGTADEWAWGTPTAWPYVCASGSGCWGTDLAGNYSANASQTLYSPVIDLSAYSSGDLLTAGWQQAWWIEEAIYDGAQAEVSIDGGAWQLMWAHSGPTTQVDWTEMTYDISAAAGTSVQFRWRLESDAGLEFPGYYIDHVRITQGCQNQAGGLVVGNVFNNLSVPLNGATVENDAGYKTFTQATPQDLSVDGGFYALFSPSGLHDFTAYGVQGYGATQKTVDVLEGGVVRQNFTLPEATPVVVSGRVTDSATGWPLYARLKIDGYTGGAVWTDPVTGAYQVTLYAGGSYVFNVSAGVPGYQPAVTVIGPLNGDLTRDFELQVDPVDCLAPGYEKFGLIGQRFEDNAVPDGWSVVNNGQEAGWAFNDPGGRGNLTGGSGGFAIADSDYYSSVPMNTELRSPVLDLSGESGVMLSFRTDYRTYFQNDTAAVDVSTNGAAGPWTRVWTQQAADLPGPAVVNLDLTTEAAGQANVMFRFHYDNALYEFWWQVDDVYINPVCQAPADGGLVVGDVLDANTSEAVPEARVMNDAGYAAQNLPGSSFFTLFSPSGSHVFTATHDIHSLYGADTVQVTALSGQTVRRDFYLPAGLLQASPGSLSASLVLSDSWTTTLNLANFGGLPLVYEVGERESLPAASGPFQVPSSVVKPFKQDYLRAAPAGRPEPPVVSTLAAAAVKQSWDARMQTPWGLAYDGFNDRVWVSSPAVDWGGDDRLIDFTTGGLKAGRMYPHLAPHTNGPADMTFNWNTGRLWIMNVNTGVANCIYEIDPAAGYTGAKICPVSDTGFAISQRGLAYDPLSDTYFAGSWNDGMVHRFAADGTLLASINLSLMISGLAYNPDSGHLFAMTSGDPTMIYKLDVQNNYNLLGAYMIDGFEPGSGAGLSIDCEGDLWAVNQKTGMVFELDLGESTSFCAADVPWLQTDPITGTVPSGGQRQLQVTFDAGRVPGPGNYAASLLVRTDSPYGVTILPVTLEVITPTVDFALDALPAFQVGQPGEWVTHTLQVTNTGTLVPGDSYSVGLSTHAWSTQVASLVGPLLPGDSDAVPVRVRIPVGAQPGATQSVDLTMTSQADPGISRSVTLTTAAIEYDVRLDPPVSEQAAEAGAVVTHTVRLINTGNVANTFDLAISGDEWAAALSAEQMTLPAGASADLQVWVEIPAGLPPGAQDTVLLTASGSGGAGADAELISMVRLEYGLLVEPSVITGTAPLGGQVEYPVRITNTGNVETIAALAVTGNTWPVSLSDTSLTLAPGESAQTGVWVTVPGTVQVGDIDHARLEIQGPGDINLQVDLYTEATQPEVFIPLLMGNR